MPEPITSAELRELLAQAAPLPWHLRYIGNRSVLGNSVCSGELDSSLRPGDSREVAFVSDALGTPYSYSGTLIVAAVNNLPGLLDTIDTLTADLTSLRERAERAEALCNDFLDADDCWFDHHGYCQAHGWFDTDPPCPHGRWRAVLAAALTTDQAAEGDN